MRIRSILLPAIAAIVVAGAGLALAAGPPASPASHASVVAAGGRVELKIHNFAFVPANLTVKPGTVITVTNLDQTAHTATSTATPPAFDTGTLQPGQSKTIKLEKPGRYSYYCQFHAFMTGTITVAG
jgi:plastocyanin